MNENDRTRLEHMLDAALEARKFIENETRESLEKNRILALALVKEIEIIGEAASKVSAQFRADNPQIPCEILPTHATISFTVISRLIWIRCGVHSKTIYCL